MKSFAFGGLRLGLSICYDLRFPEVYRTLAIEQRANVFILSSAWPFPRLEHFRTLAAARAIENQSYMIVSNRVGTDDGVTCCGSSMIIDPYGVTLASASTDREELVLAEVSEAAITSVRNKMAVFANADQMFTGRADVETRDKLRVIPSRADGEGPHRRYFATALQKAPT